MSKFLPSHFILFLGLYVFVPELGCPSTVAMQWVLDKEIQTFYLSSFLVLSLNFQKKFRNSKLN